jgi:hypothetical protein
MFCVTRRCGSCLLESFLYPPTGSTDSAMSCEMMNLAGLSEAEFRDGCTYLVRVMLVFIAAVSVEDGLGAWLRRGGHEIQVGSRR